MLYLWNMNAMTTARRTLRSNRAPRWDVVIYRGIGAGRTVGPGYGRLADAQTAALTLQPRLGEVLAVEANVDVQVAQYARIGGRWVPNPSLLDLVAATWAVGQLEHGYARQLWSSLAGRATARANFWSCAYVTSTETVMAYVWAERPAAWAWDLADGDSAQARPVTLPQAYAPAQLAAAA